jgi:F0F1-type ATP synthase membrane subunit b/b'
MGLVNEAAATFIIWLDTRAQPVSDTVKRAREAQFQAEKDLVRRKEDLRTAKEECMDVLKQLKRDKKIIGQERRAAKGEADIEQCDLKLILVDVEIDEIEELLKEAADAVTETNNVLKLSKVELTKLKLDRGCPAESLLSQNEKVLYKFGVKREAYHGKDFNGVSCRNLVRSITEIIKELNVIVLREKLGTVPNKEANKKLEDFLLLCGLIDAAFDALSLIDPTPKEMDDA